MYDGEPKAYLHISGHMKHLYLKLEEFDSVPEELISELRNISEIAGKLANRAIPHVFEDDPEYFKAVG